MEELRRLSVEDTTLTYEEPLEVMGKSLLSVDPFTNGEEGITFLCIDVKDSSVTLGLTMEELNKLIDTLNWAKEKVSLLSTQEKEGVG